MNMQLQFLKLQASGTIRYISHNEIIYLKADGNYTCFMLKDHSKFTMCQSLLNYEIELGNPFFRCHKSYLINTTYIRAINNRNHQITLTTEETIPFSRNKSKIIEEKMKLKSSLSYSI